MLRNTFHFADAVSKMQKLKPNLTTLSSKHRIEFACLAYKYAYQEIISHDLTDSHNLTERDLGRCFEMGDGKDVVHGLIKLAKNDETLEKSIRDTGATVWDSWYQIFLDQEKQVNLF